jgi:hypothetical protein
MTKAVEGCPRRWSVAAMGSSIAAAFNLPRWRREVRPFSADEDSKLLGWVKEGVGYSRIAERLGRSQNSIRYRLLSLARHERLTKGRQTIS